MATALEDYVRLLLKLQLQLGGLSDSPMRILGAYQDCLKTVHRGYTSMTYTQSMIVCLKIVYIDLTVG